MISLTVIGQKVDVAKLYLQKLLDEYRANIKKGCSDKPKDLNCVKWLIMALNADIRDDINTLKTQKLYAELCTVLGAYSESYELDPSVIIPDTVIVVDGGSLPPIIYTQDDLLQDSNDQWYLPLIKNGDAILATSVFVVYNGESMPGAQLSQNNTPYRIYGFFSNDTATIKVTYSI